MNQKEKITKDFEKWCKLKKDLHNRQKRIYAKKREIWWCSLGCNIGYEQDGKNERFERPVLILKKFNNYLLLVVPLSSKIKKGNKYYYTFKYKNRIGSVILSQTRVISSNRLLRRFGKFPSDSFVKVRGKVGEFYK